MFAEIFGEGSFRFFIVYVIVGLYCLHRMIKKADPTGAATKVAARGIFSWLFRK